MEAGIFPWTPFDTTSLWAVPPATPSAWTTPSNLSVSGTANPAVQTVLTLNLTSDANLTYLLAALLDNNTTLPDGQLGVNGYFVDITNELPSLGLSSAVTGALANEVLSSGGFFGYPTSYAQPPPPPPPPQPTCSGFGCLWNTVSGAFVALGQTIAAGIAGIAGAVWSGVQAATTYFEEAGQGLVQLAEAARDAAISALAVVASAVEAALQALVSYIVSIVDAFIKKALSPFIADIQAASDEFQTQFSDIANGVAGLEQSPGSVTTNDVANSLSDVVAGFFGIATVISTVGLVATGVATSVSLGAGFVILIPLIITALLVLISQGGPPGLPGAGLLHTFTQEVSGATGSIALFATQVAEYVFNATQPVKSTVLQPFVPYNPSQPAIVSNDAHPDSSSTGDVWSLLSLIVAVELTYKLAFLATFAESPPVDLELAGTLAALSYIMLIFIALWSTTLPTSCSTQQEQGDYWAYATANVVMAELAGIGAGLAAFSIGSALGVWAVILLVLGLAGTFFALASTYGALQTCGFV
jgi:hypothetical protein